MSNLAYGDFTKGLRESLEQFGNNGRRPDGSYIDQLRNANSGLSYYNANYDKLSAADQQRAKAAQAGIRSMKGSAIANSAIAGIGGVTDILNTSLNAAKIQDTSQYQNEIADLSRAGAMNYNSYDQLANDMAMTDFNVGVDYNDIRGMGGKGVTKEKIGAVGSSMMSGASTGMQIGGPWGAAIGAVVGGGAALAGILSGDQKARIEEDHLNLQAQRAQMSANENFAAAHERISETNNRYNMVNAVAFGGQISRVKRKQSIAEFANKVAKTPRLRERKPVNIVSKKCNGGLMVRLKAK